MTSDPVETPQLPKDRTERNLFAWSLLVSLVLLGAMAGPFLVGRIYTRDDLGATHLPFRAFYAEQLARGEPFDWMPQVFSGFYLTGEGQAGTYHPLHWVLYRFLPLQAALAGEYLATYPFMLVGCYLFLRRRLGRRDAAMLGSLAFTFSGFNLLHFAHPNAIAIVAHIPWLLWTIDLALTDPNRRNVAVAEVGIALLTGSELLLGYPQYVWFSLIAEAAWAGYLLFARPHARLQGEPSLWLGSSAASPQLPGAHCNPWHRVPIAKACGLLLGGIQLLPTIDSLSHAARRAGDASFANWGSLHPGNLVQLIAPYLLTDRVLGENTHELGVYVGMVPLLLVVWVRIRHRELGALRHLTWALVAFGTLAMVLAFGEAGQLYKLQRFLPLVGNFRCPCRYLVLFYLAMAALAAIGFMLLLKEHQRHRPGQDDSHIDDNGTTRAGRLLQTLWHPYRGIWLTVIAAALVALGGVVMRDSSYVGRLAGVLAGPVLLAIGAILIVAAARGARMALVGLIVLTAVDLGVYGLSYAVYPRTYRLDQYIAWTPTPPSEPDGRVVIDMIRFDERELHTGNQVTLTGWHRAGGYVGLEPRRRLDYRDLPALRVAGVRWVKRGKSTDRLAGLIEHDEKWLEVPRPLPKVRLLSHTLWSDEPAVDIRRIDVDSTALVEVRLASAAVMLPDTSQQPTAKRQATAKRQGTVEVVSHRPGYLQIRYDCSIPQLLVVSESYHPGWKARVAGKAQPVLRVNGDFIGCLVGPAVQTPGSQTSGSQTLVLEFRPQSLARGWIASCFGLAIVFASFVGYRFQPPSVATPAND